MNNYQNNASTTPCIHHGIEKLTRLQSNVRVEQSG